MTDPVMKDADRHGVDVPVWERNVNTDTDNNRDDSDMSTDNVTFERLEASDDKQIPEIETADEDDSNEDPMSATPSDDGSTDSTDSDSDYDVTQKTMKTATGFTLEVTSKRGTGTRDQDTVRAKGKFETLGDLEDNRDDLVFEVQEALRAQRDFDPDEDSETDG